MSFDTGATAPGNAVCEGRNAPSCGKARRSGYGR